VTHGLPSWPTLLQALTLFHQSLAHYCEVVWIHQLLHELGLDMNAPTTIMCDNQITIKLSKNLVFHDKTKHFETYWHFI
jgi:hypothetical protein